MTTNPGNASSTAAHFIEKVNIVANPTLSGLDKAIIKSTKRTLKPLKMKHISLIVSVTWQRQLVFYDLFKHLENRLKEQHWVITFKTLIVMHILMKEGNTEKVYQFFDQQLSILNMAGFRDKSGSSIGYEQSKNLKAYAIYLEEKVAAYRNLKRDPIKERDFEMARLRSLSVNGENNLLDEISRLQQLLQSLLGCKYLAEEIDNIVTMQSFRLLLGDVLVLFALVNEGIIHLLEKFFNMNRQCATQALAIYKQFTVQTTKVVEFLNLAKQLQRALDFEAPAITHAPVSLVQILEDYLKENPEMAGVDAFKSKPQPADLIAQVPGNAKASSNNQPLIGVQAITSSNHHVNTKEKPLLDFFDSLENEYVATSSVAAPMGNPLLLEAGPSTTQGRSSTNPFNNSVAAYSHNPFFSHPMAGNNGYVSSPPLQPQSLAQTVNSPPLTATQLQPQVYQSNVNPFNRQTQPLAVPFQEQQALQSYQSSGGAYMVSNAGAAPYYSPNLNSSNPFARSSAVSSPPGSYQQLTPQPQINTLSNSTAMTTTSVSSTSGVRFANFDAAFPTAGQSSFNPFAANQQTSVPLNNPPPQPQGVYNFSNFN